MKHAIESNGIVIARTPTGLGVMWPSLHPPMPNQMLNIELWYGGKLYKSDMMQTYGPAYREYLGREIDHLKVTIRVKALLGGSLLAELGCEETDDIKPFMVLQGPQHHITESGVSVPPALHITDEVGAVWTLGMIRAAKEQSPDGEFAFAVLRDGIDTHEIASRIERRSGKIRVFTRHGWKVFNGASFF